MTLPADLAPGAPDWPRLATLIAGCTACPDLVAGRRQVVVGVLPPGARVLLVGEAPGEREDATGLPFVGRAGQLLDELIAAAGLDRAALAVVNVLKCRPPGNRKPTGAEVGRCVPWLERQIELAAPRVVMALGGTAAAWALGRPVKLKDVRGRVHELAGRHLVISYHPSAAVRFGPAGAPRAALAEDLRRVADLAAGRLGGPEPGVAAEAGGRTGAGVRDEPGVAAEPPAPEGIRG